MMTAPDPDALQALTAAAYEARPAETAPKDGTMLRLLLDYSSEDAGGSLEDADQAWTIGFNTMADQGEDEWIIAGWNWAHDCWSSGYGKIIGWLPFAPDAPADALAAQARRDARRDAQMMARGMREAATGNGWEDFVADNAPAHLSDWQRGLVAGQQALRSAINARAAELEKDEKL